jgi:hypothetical protein
MKLSPNMMSMLERMKKEKLSTTSFGYCPLQKSHVFLHAKTVQALIARGLLEQAGEIPWNGRTIPLYQPPSVE